MTILPKKKPAQQKNEGENSDPNSYHGDPRHGHPQENRDRYNYSNRNSPPRWPSSGSREEKRPAHSTGPTFDEYENVENGPSHSKRRHRASPHRSIRKSHSHTHTNHNHRNNPSPSSFTNPGPSHGGHSPSQDRHSPVGQTSTSESQNNDQPGYNSEDEYDRPAEMWTPEEADEREKLFEKRLRKKGFTIKKMGEDGACLFRAVADQVYGDQEMHAGVRKLCMDYMAKNSDYFSQYVTEDFDKYIERKRCDHIHGNHIEMQALSEMYNRPIEVYHYGTEPMNIFHGSQKTDNEPIRLSYHRNVHYNSIVDPYKATIGVGLGLPSFTPGMSEKLYEIGSHPGVVDIPGKHADKSLVKEAIRVSEDLELEQAMLEDKLRATDWEATNEAIEEQIARESYLEWLRENEMRTQKKIRSATATSSSSLASEGASGGMSPQCAGWSSPRCRNIGGLSSPKIEAAATAAATTSSEDKGSKSPEKMSSPKASCSGTISASFSASEGCTSSTATGSSSQTAGMSAEEFSLIESATFMNQLPPSVFGLSDWEDGDILARVLAESQQEYLDSLKRTVSSNKDSEPSCS